MSLSFRPATSEDSAQIARVQMAAVRRGAHEHYSDAQIESWLFGLSAVFFAEAMEDGEHFEVATEDGAVIGFCSHISGEVTGLYIDPARMRRGVGTALLARAEARLRADGYASAQVTASRNAHVFYTRLGYTDMRAYRKRTRGGLEQEVTDMEKSLKDPGGPGGRIDPDRSFVPVRIAVLTVSDTRTLADDKSGATLQERILEAGHELAARAIVKDEIPAIIRQLREWIADRQIDCIISTGGTGLTGRDVTPEAMRQVFEKEIDGFSAVFHRVSYETIGTSTLQSRACAGVAGGTYIFALPGSPGACRDGWDKILKFQLDNRFRPCNFVEIMPRLLES